MSTNSGIPMPDFQSSRKRRSSIGQGAALSGETQPSATRPPTPQPPAASLRTMTDPPAPLPTTEDDPAPEQHTAAARSGGVGRPSKLAAVETPNKRLAGSKDILLSLPEDLKDRMISTIAWSRPYTGIGHQQKFIRKAIQELCERLETELNDGKPFPAPVADTD